MSYLPVPPRVWSRVQNECSVNTNSSNLVYEPLTKQYLTQVEYNRQKQIQMKGNILQYKKNSSQLTKSQKYSQIAKGQWTNRTKTWATQSLTYSNPNTTSLQRVNTSTLAATANTPFVSNIYTIPTNPFGCPIDLSGGILDGGNLVATVTVNPCTNEIIKTTTISNCNLSTDCDVPGPPIALCWNPKLPTYYPRQNLTNNNSTDKWPVNYKGLVSALKPNSPILNGIGNCDVINLYWSYQSNGCLPITSFNIYVNGNLYTNISVGIDSYVFDEPNGIYKIYITSLSSNIESEPSNTIVIVLDAQYIIISDSNINVTQYNNFGFKGIIFETNLQPGPSGGQGELIFKLCERLTVTALMAGGGGGGGDYSFIKQPQNDIYIGAGGGGCGINYITGFVPPLNTEITMKIGSGGRGGIYEAGLNGSGQNGFDTIISYSSSSYYATGGIGGGGISYGQTTVNVGGGNGGNASLTLNVGYGGGGGGGGSTSNDNIAITNGGTGGQGGTSGSNGSNGSGGTGTTGGNGGNSTLYTFFIPFLNQNIYIGGGGGGGSTSYGGNAGNGIGGVGGGYINDLYIGESATNYGGGGGGGGTGIINFTTDGGNGGNGVIIIWWSL
jgi:hypothetical protein